jgi:hypothetical protein
MQVFKLYQKLLQKLKLLFQPDVLLSFLADFFESYASAFLGRGILIEGMP